jgi:hypothetical protein
MEELLGMIEENDDALLEITLKEAIAVTEASICRTAKPN